VVATELSSGAITSILEAVPGIATVLRSPVADAIVNLSRAAAGLIPFNPKDAHELLRYAVRRGLIRSDEGDRVAAEIDGLPPSKVAVKVEAPAPAPRPAAHHSPFHRKPAAPHAPPHKKPVAKAAARKPKAAAKSKSKPKPRLKPKPKKKTAPRPKAKAASKKKK
jgi:hypothetical protein